MRAKERRELLARYSAGYDVLAAAVAGCRKQSWTLSPPTAAGRRARSFTHCADNEMTSAIRLRRLLAEDEPMITGYDQMEFAQRLHYERPVEASPPRRPRGADHERPDPGARRGGGLGPQWHPYRPRLVRRGGLAAYLCRPLSRPCCADTGRVAALKRSGATRAADRG